MTHHQFKKNEKNESENSHTKSEKEKKKLIAGQTQARPKAVNTSNPANHDPPQTLPAVASLKPC
jgi:hypothetical protein